MERYFPIKPGQQVKSKGVFHYAKDSEFKWKGPFRFLPTGIFGITSGGGPLIPVGKYSDRNSQLHF